MIPTAWEDRENVCYFEPPLNVSGDADRYDHRVGYDDYTQPGNIFRLKNDDQKEPPFSNIASTDGVPEGIQVHQLVHFYRADPDYALGVATKLNPSHAGEKAAALAELSLAELIVQASAEAYMEQQSTPAECWPMPPADLEAAHSLR